MALTQKQLAMLDSCPILKEFKDVFMEMGGETSSSTTTPEDSGNGGESSSSTTTPEDSGNGGNDSPITPPEETPETNENP